MTTSLAVVVAVCFVWFGMVVGISFIEAPLKFRAPGITLPLGLGIGRLVFRALNAVEVVLALILIAGLLIGTPPAGTVWALGTAVLALILQLVAVRPALTRRSDAVLAGEHTGRRSRVHVVYVALELVKVLALLIGGTMLLSIGG